MSLYIGIDFGTSTNLVTRWNEEKKRVDHIPGFGGHGESDVFPNVIYYESPESILIGNAAENKGKNDPYNYVEAIKRHIGEKNYRQYIPNLNRELTSEDIAKDIFTCIRKKIEATYGGEKIDAVVISVPFAYQHTERARIKNAAINAGMNVIGLIEEPVAAALTYGLRTDINNTRERILVFDMGGGTLDVTMFDFKKKSENNFLVWVCGTDGDKKLGGRDVDEIIKQKLYGMVQNKYEEYRLDDYLEDKRETDFATLRTEAVELKKNLSDDPDAEAFVQFRSQINKEWKLEEYIEAEFLDDTLKNVGFLNRIKNVLINIQEDLEDRGEDIDSIDKILLVGGSTNIPAIQTIVKDFFDKEPEFSINPPVDELVGEGAAIYCGIIKDNNVHYSIKSCVSHSIGVKEIGSGRFIPILEKNTLYGKESEIYKVKFKYSDRDEEIKIFQYVNDNYALVGTIEISENDKSNTSDKEIGLQLNTDQSGMIKYVLFDQYDNKLREDYIREAE